MKFVIIFGERKLNNLLNNKFLILILLRERNIEVKGLLFNKLFSFFLLEMIVSFIFNEILFILL